MSHSPGQYFAETVGLYFAHLEQLWRAGADWQGPEQATGALQPLPFPGVWPLVLQPSSDVMQLYNLGSDCCGKSCAGKVMRCFHGKGPSSFAWELHLTSASWFFKPYCRQTCNWLADWMPQLDLGPASSPLVCDRAWFASPDLLCSPCLGTRGLYPCRRGLYLCLPSMPRLTCPGRAACPDLHNTGSGEKEKFNLWSNFGRCNSLTPTELKKQPIGLRYGTGYARRGQTLTKSTERDKALAEHRPCQEYELAFHPYPVHSSVYRYCNSLCSVLI